LFGLAKILFVAKTLQHALAAAGHAPRRPHSTRLLEPRLPSPPQHTGGSRGEHPWISIGSRGRLGPVRRERGSEEEGLRGRGGVGGIGTGKKKEKSCRGWESSRGHRRQSRGVEDGASARVEACSARVEASDP